MNTATHLPPTRARTVSGVKEPPLQTFVDVYLRNHVAQCRTAKTMTGTIRHYFGPLMVMPLDQLTPIQIEEWFHTIGTHSPSMGNKCLSILKTMFEKARDWRMFNGDNPCSRIKKYKERSRKRFVQPEEMPRVMAALRERDEPTQCYFLLCLLVGCRRTEGLTMRWEDLDTARGLWHKPHTKTDRSQVVPVPLTLLRRLADLPKTNEFVFATDHGHWSASLAFERWDLIRSQAGIPDVTIHDLRRTCASWLACHGENLAIIGNVLNHTSLQYTGIYARLNISPVSRALEENSVRMLPTAPPLCAVERASNGGRHDPVVMSEREIVPVPVSPLPPRPVIVPPVAEGSDERDPPSLSERDREMLASLAQGQSCTSIAARLGISSKTVSTYRGRLMHKLRVTNMVQLIRYAIEHEADLPLPVPARPTPPPVIAPPVVVPMIPAPMPIVHRSRSVEREEWPG